MFCGVFWMYNVDNCVGVLIGECVMVVFVVDSVWCLVNLVYGVLLIVIFIGVVLGV